jgi:2-(1,2-epoxy-1,2-dihydrophenyl)acetyl-CoA isomerase
LEYATIEYKEKGPVVIISFNRPAKRNAINEAMGQELVDCLNRCAEKSSIGAIILTGKGAVFCSGGNIDAQWLRDIHGFGSKDYDRK